jgi:hypothetical protein
MEELLGTTPVTETPAQEVPQKPETPAEPVADSTQEPLEDADQTIGIEPEVEEVEFSGNKYKVPKELVPIIAKAENLEAGVTRRFQEAAELRKAAEAELQTVGRERQISSELTSELGQLANVESRLAQFQNVNWQQWQAADSPSANAAMAEMMQLQDARQQLSGNIENRKAEIGAMIEQRAATMISQAVEALTKPDPKLGWAGKFDVTTKDNLTKFGKEIGYTDAELAGTTHPLMIKTLNLAKIGYETLRKQQASATAPKIAAAPVSQVSSGKTRSTVDPDKLSTEEWTKWRNSQVAKNRG